MIRKGYVKITTMLRDGREALLAIRVPGDIIGELAAFSGQERSATATACGSVIASSIPHGALSSFLGRHPSASQELTAAVGERLTWANRRRLDSAEFRVDDRVARALAELVRLCGRRDRDGIVLAITLTQAELASMVAASEAAVHKALRQLSDQGIIDTAYRAIIVIDPGRLAELAEQPE